MDYRLLTNENAAQYIGLLKEAILAEPDMMWVEEADEAGIRNRLDDPFYRNTKSILALDGERAVGRIEYHFYGCLQDGFRMAYVDWVYVLPEYRHKGIARQLFKAFENDCAENMIDQYFLLRAVNPEADRFYKGFESAELSDEPILRKNIGDK